jgi:hypothetical protein
VTGASDKTSQPGRLKPVKRNQHRKKCSFSVLFEFHLKERGEKTSGGGSMDQPEKLLATNKEYRKTN